MEDDLPPQLYSDLKLSPTQHRQNCFNRIVSKLLEKVTWLPNNPQAGNRDVEDQPDGVFYSAQEVLHTVYSTQSLKMLLRKGTGQES
jgi:hypothetical protein